MSDVIAQYREMHKNPRRFRGKIRAGNAKRIKALCKKHDAETVLDYGCGKGLQYTADQIHLDWGVDITMYDPGVPTMDGRPIVTFDGVICLDVLEHVEPHKLGDTLDDIIAYAREFALLWISTVRSRKRLPDGRNCHLIVQPAEAWIEDVWRAIHRANRPLMATTQKVNEKGVTISIEAVH